MVEQKELERLSRLLDRVSAYLEAISERMLDASPESILELSPVQLREDFEFFSRTQINILEFVRKWQVQNKGRGEYGGLPVEVLKLAKDLNSLNASELVSLRESLSGISPDNGMPIKESM